MNKRFYRVWLPASLAVHLALVLLMAGVKITALAETGPPLYIIRVVTLPEAEPVDQPVTATPPQQIRDTTVVQPGVAAPKATDGNGQSKTIVIHPGPGTKPTVAPAVMTAPTGKVEVPTGHPDGVGTQGSGDLGPSGPSSGAGLGRKGAAVYPKTALDDGIEGTVEVSVTVGPTGAIDAAWVSKSSGFAVLDRQARRDVNSWQFTPALEKGIPVSATVQLSFRYENGNVEGKMLK